MTPAQIEWARCRGWIEAAAATTGHYGIEDIEAAIADGSMTFWPGERCAAITRIIEYPRCKVLNIFAGGGDIKELMAMGPRIEAFARELGCKKIVMFASDPRLAHAMKRLGGKHQWTCMAKELE